MGYHGPGHVLQGARRLDEVFTESAGTTRRHSGEATHYLVEKTTVCAMFPLPCSSGVALTKSQNQNVAVVAAAVRRP